MSCFGNISKFGLFYGNRFYHGRAMAVSSEISRSPAPLMVVGSSTNLDTTVKLNKGESTQKFSQFIKKESWIFHLFFWGQMTPGLVAPTHLGWFELYKRSPWSLLKLSNCYLGFVEKDFHRKPRCRIVQQQVSLFFPY